MKENNVTGQPWSEENKVLDEVKLQFHKRLRLGVPGSFSELHQALYSGIDDLAELLLGLHKYKIPTHKELLKLVFSEIINPRISGDKYKTSDIFKITDDSGNDVRNDLFILHRINDSGKKYGYIAGIIHWEVSGYHGDWFKTDLDDVVNFFEILRIFDLCNSFTKYAVNLPDDCNISKIKYMNGTLYAPIVDYIQFDPGRCEDIGRSISSASKSDLSKKTTTKGRVE